MKAKPAAIVEALVVRETPPTPKKEDNFSSEERVIVLGKPEPPSPHEILRAIETLSSVRADLEGQAPEGSKGDLFLVYDLVLRAKDQKPYRIRGSVTMHGVLSGTGIPDAAAELDTALAHMVRPIKARGAELINEAREETRGSSIVEWPQRR